MSFAPDGVNGRSAAGGSSKVELSNTTRMMATGSPCALAALAAIHDSISTTSADVAARSAARSATVAVGEADHATLANSQDNKRVAAH